MIGNTGLDDCKECEVIDASEVNDYRCPEHLDYGNPKCSVCWANLRRMVKDHNGTIVGDVEVEEYFKNGK